MKITGITITPVAFADPPLLNAVGVHEPFGLRAVVEVTTDAGLTGLGETYADEHHLGALRAVARVIEGLDVYHTEEIYLRVADVVGQGGHAIASGTVGDTPAADPVFSPFEVACLDIQAKAAGRPVADLLGGAVRDEVPFSAYLFYKWAAHPGRDQDDWGAALDADGIVRQARRMIGEYGFTALKLKGGVFPPRQEAEAVHALRAAFPGHPLRLDPNAAWTPGTAIAVARDLDGVLEYLEDPTAGIDGMAQVAAHAPMPLATNMCVIAFEHLPSAIKEGAVQVVLADPHYWGGLRKSKLLAGICQTFGLGVSMHSDPHLGISLAAMVHLAAATPNLGYACDTHFPWRQEDVLKGTPLAFRGGAIRVPDGPGLGVELDHDALAVLHEQYLRCGIRTRDDTGYMRRVHPGYRLERPRWLSARSGRLYRCRYAYRCRHYGHRVARWAKARLSGVLGLLSRLGRYARMSRADGGRGMSRRTLILFAWLIIGAAAAGQRGYFSNTIVGCSQGATIAVTIAAGPLNYLGMNPTVACNVPKPAS